MRNSWTKAVFMPPRSKIGGILFLSCLSFCPPLWNFNLANNFWTVCARALIFHLSIPYDKTFPWVPLMLTLWHWPGSLTQFLKTLTLQITFEQRVLELWYFTWVFLVIRRGYHYFLPYDLDLGVWPSLKKNLTLLIMFGKWVLELWYCTYENFPWVSLFLCPPWKRGHIVLQLSVGRSVGMSVCRPSVVRSISFDPFTWSIPNLVQGWP